jgi:hypothetical protein
MHDIIFKLAVSFQIKWYGQVGDDGEVMTGGVEQEDEKMRMTILCPRILSEVNYSVGS